MEKDNQIQIPTKSFSSIPFKRNLRPPPMIPSHRPSIMPATSLTSMCLHVSLNFFGGRGRHVFVVFKERKEKGEDRKQTGSWRSRGERDIDKGREREKSVRQGRWWKDIETLNCVCRRSSLSSFVSQCPRPRCHISLVD